MGGQSRRDMKSGKSFERTHLIESTTDSDNYKVNIPLIALMANHNFLYNVFLLVCYDLWDSHSQ